MPGSYFTLALSEILCYINIFTASPLWWNRAFLSVTQRACEGKPISSKAAKGSAGTGCYSAAKASSPLPAALFSQFHEPWEDGEGCVGWGTFMSQEAFSSWAWDWLYGHSLCCVLTKWNGKCSWVLQECLEVAEVFDEQPGWDLSLLGAFCCVNTA